MENKTFIIAEAGVNHNGNIEIAKKMIEVAKQCGSDAIKFQTFKTEEVISKYAPKAEYQKINTGETEYQLEVEIGFPYLEEKENMARQLKNQEIRDKKNILIISGGSFPKEYNNLVKNLYNFLDRNRLKIVFRPHPSERIALNERYKDIIKYYKYRR